MTSIPARRLLAQELGRPRFTQPAELVSWMGAMQAQDYAGTKWAVAVRLRQKQPNEAAIERALTDGTILRTHIFRWTWQLVTPADIRWMLSLVASRLVQSSSTRNRELGIDRRLMNRSQAVFEKALRHGDPLTRDEMSEALAAAGIRATGPKLAQLLGMAEFEAVVCSGARRGKQNTYALLEQRAPAAQLPSRDEALAEIARRYFRSRGPARVVDFCWWTGLAPAEARGAIESIQRSLESEVIDGVPHYFVADSRKPMKSVHVELVPAFDEWLVAYRHRDAVLDPAQVKRINAGGGLLAPSVLVDGRVVGIWRRELSRDSVAISIDCFEPVSATTKREIVVRAERYAAFLGLEPKVRFARLL